MPFSICEDDPDEDDEEEERGNDVSRSSAESKKTRSIKKLKKLSPSSRAQSFKKKRTLNARRRSSRAFFPLVTTVSAEYEESTLLNADGCEFKPQNPKSSSMANILNLASMDSTTTQASSSLNDNLASNHSYLPKQSHFNLNSNI